jgi:hypothetical protein
MKLNAAGQITELVSTWDGSLTAPATLDSEMALAIEG